MIKTITLLLLGAALLAGGAPGAHAAAIALYPAEPAGHPLAAETDRWLSWALGRRYRALEAETFQPVIEAEQARRPETTGDPDAFFPVLERELGVRYIVTIRLEDEETENDVRTTCRLLVLETATGRSGLILETALPARPGSADLRRVGLQAAALLQRRDRQGVSAAGGEATAALKQLAGRHPLPTLTAVILEDTPGREAARPLAEILFRRYLRVAGYPFRDGESDLLRTYARSHFGNGGWSFPRTLVSDFFIIGEARTGEHALHEGLAGAEARLEVKVLDRRGHVLTERTITTVAYGLDFDEAAAARALNAAVTEMCFLLVPELQFRRR